MLFAVGIGVGLSSVAGVRAYLLNYGQRFNPFVSAHVAWASGLQFDVGGEEDDNGNQLNRDDISRFNIPTGRPCTSKPVSGGCTGAAPCWWA